MEDHVSTLDSKEQSGGFRFIIHDNNNIVTTNGSLDIAVDTAILELDANKRVPGIASLQDIPVYLGSKAPEIVIWEHLGDDSNLLLRTMQSKMYEGPLRLGFLYSENGTLLYINSPQIFEQKVDLGSDVEHQMKSELGFVWTHEVEHLFQISDELRRKQFEDEKEEMNFF